MALDLLFKASCIVSGITGVSLICKTYYGYVKYEGEEKLTGKVALVTGASSGIGKQIATRLAERDATVILASRDKETCKNVKYKIFSKCGNDKLYCSEVDFEDFKSVRDFTSRIKAKIEKIDILVNNAGFRGGRNRIETADFIEKQLKVNTLSPYLVTAELLPLLQKSDDPRVVTMICGMYKDGYIKKDDINSVKLYERDQAFNQAQLMNVLMMEHFTRTITPKSNITFNCANPGLVNTAYYDNENYNNNVLSRNIFRIINLFLLRSEWQGADTAVMLCANEGMKGKSGHVYYDLQDQPVNEVALNSDLGKWVYEFCKKWTRKSLDTSMVENKIMEKVVK